MLAKCAGGAIIKPSQHKMIFESHAMNTAIEIKIKTNASGKRMALYRRQGGLSKFWHMMPVRQAEKALRDGKVSIGFAVDAPAVAV